MTEFVGHGVRVKGPPDSRLPNVSRLPVFKEHGQHVVINRTNLEKYYRVQYCFVVRDGAPTVCCVGIPSMLVPERGLAMMQVSLAGEVRDHLSHPSRAATPCGAPLVESTTFAR